MFLDGIAPFTVVLLCLVALAAGWIDAVSGGGGLLQLPSLLIALPQAPPATAMGTNKLSSIIGTAAAARTYMQQVTLDLSTAMPMMVAAFIGSAAGSALATSIPAHIYKPIIFVMLVAVWVWTLLRPAMGEQDNLRWDGTTHRVIATIAGALIGFYDGLIGPGTGAFLLITLVALLGYSFLAASATAKLVNLGTNLASIIVFGFTGNVLWLLGLLMGGFNLVGGVLGARTAVKRGSKFVRIVFLTVVGLLILRLAFDVF